MRSVAWLAPMRLAGTTSVVSQPLQKSSASADKYEVPAEMARPAGTGPLPPVLYIHARRGFEDEDRAHMRELARRGSSCWRRTGRSRT